MLNLLEPRSAPPPDSGLCSLVLVTVERIKAESAGGGAWSRNVINIMLLPTVFLESGGHQDHLSFSDCWRTLTAQPINCFIGLKFEARLK